MRRLVSPLLWALMLLLVGPGSAGLARAQLTPISGAAPTSLVPTGPAVSGAARSSRQAPPDEVSRGLFHRIELGFVAGNPSLILESVAESVDLDLGSGRRGSYSANQTFFLLQDFFRVCVPVSFSFNRYGSGRQPFAVGQYEYMQRDVLGQSRVFVSLTQGADGAWRIDGIRIDPLVP